MRVSIQHLTIIHAPIQYTNVLEQPREEHHTTHLLYFGLHSSVLQLARSSLMTGWGKKTCFKIGKHQWWQGFQTYRTSELLSACQKLGVAIQGEDSDGSSFSSSSSSSATGSSMAGITSTSRRRGKNDSKGTTTTLPSGISQGRKLSLHFASRLRRARASVW